MTERQHLILDGLGRSPLAVVRIRPDDTLSLRAAPGVGSEISAKLPFRFEGLRPTGRACRVNDALWVEVQTTASQGWVNQRYAQPASAFRPLDGLGETPLARLTAPTLQKLSALLHRTLTSHSGIGPSGRSEVELVGAHVQGNRAQVVLFDGHGGDDSISGEEYAATAVLDSGSWRVERLEQRETCWRGVSEGLCL